MDARRFVVVTPFHTLFDLFIFFICMSFVDTTCTQNYKPGIFYVFFKTTVLMILGMEVSSPRVSPTHSQQLYVDIITDEYFKDETRF